jgi:signal transduction histidine kinase
LLLLLILWAGPYQEGKATQRIGAMAGGYLEALLLPQLQGLGEAQTLSPAAREAVDRLLEHPHLVERISSVTIRLHDGSVIYRSGSARSAPASRVNDPRSFSAHVPVPGPDGEALATVELQGAMAAIDAEVRGALWTIGGGIAGSSLLIYLLTVGMVHRATRTIGTQHSKLRRQVTELRELAEENRRVSNRIRSAGARMTAANEAYLRRVAADLHDGAAQELAAALLRLEAVTSACLSCAKPRTAGMAGVELEVVSRTLTAALDEIRGVLSDFRIPGIADKSVAEVTTRAVRDHQRRTRVHVAVALDRVPEDAPLAVKITLYRIVQEALMNGFRHAQGLGQSVRVALVGDELHVEVADSGPGMPRQRDIDAGRLGVVGMRERSELLGGSFSIDSVQGKGTTVRVRLPLRLPEGDEEA